MSRETNPTQTAPSGDFEAAFKAGRASHVEPVIHTGENGTPFFLHPTTREPVSLEQFLKAPAREITHRKFVRIEDLIGYANRFKRLESSIYSVGDTITLEVKHRSPNGETAWTDHTASVTLQRTDSFRQWLASDKQALSQEQFAEFLEDHSIEVLRPDAAEMLEIARTLSIQKSSSVRSVLRTAGGHSLAFNRDQQARAGAADELEIPTQFEVRLTPFKHVNASFDTIARLKVRLRDDTVKFVFELQKVEERTDEVLAQILDDIAAKTSLPVYR